jgi:hypothetical protein
MRSKDRHQIRKRLTDDAPGMSLLLFGGLAVLVAHMGTHFEASWDLRKLQTVKSLAGCVIGR